MSLENGVLVGRSQVWKLQSRGRIRSAMGRNGGSIPVCCPCAIQIRRFGQPYGLFLTTQGPESRSGQPHLRFKRTDQRNGLSELHVRGASRGKWLCAFYKLSSSYTRLPECTHAPVPCSLPTHAIYMSPVAAAATAPPPPRQRCSTACAGRPGGYGQKWACPCTVGRRGAEFRV